MEIRNNNGTTIFYIVPTGGLTWNLIHGDTMTTGVQVYVNRQIINHQYVWVGFDY